MFAWSDVTAYLTRIQEVWLTTLCQGGVVVHSCNPYSHDASCGTFSHVDGLGYLAWTFEQVEGTGACCEHAYWKELAQEQVKNIGGIVERLELESVLENEIASWVREAMSSLVEQGMRWAPVSSALVCESCNILYHLVQVVAQFAQWLAWGAFYSEASREGAIPREYAFEFHRGVNRRFIVPSLLKEQQALIESRALRAVEVGVYHGETSASWLSQIPQLEMLLVDPHLESMYTTLYLTEPLEDMKLLRRRMAPHIDSGRAVMLTAPSVSAASWVSNSSLDLVFLDGDHTRQALADDIQAWAPKLRPGGIMAGHDYDPFVVWTSGGSPRRVPLADPESTAAAVHAALPPGKTLHLAPDFVWWWSA